MITGAPNNGVTAFNGKMVCENGKIVMMLHKRATALPNSSVTGSSNL